MVDLRPTAVRASFREGFSYAVLSFIAGAVVGVGSSIVVARLYGVDVVGQYALAIAPMGVVWFLSTARERPALIRALSPLAPRAARITGLFAAVFAFSAALSRCRRDPGLWSDVPALHGPNRPTGPVRSERRMSRRLCARHQHGLESRRDLLGLPRRPATVLDSAASVCRVPARCGPCQCGWGNGMEPRRRPAHGLGDVAGSPALGRPQVDAARSPAGRDPGRVSGPCPRFSSSGSR